MDRATFRKRQQTIFTTIRSAYMAYSAWWSCRNNSNFQKYESAMARHWLYFTASFPALLYFPVIQGYKLFERRQDTLNFPKLLADAEAHGFIDATRAGEIRTAIQSLNPTWQKIKIIRNKYVAHIDENFDSSAVFKIAGLTYDELREFLLVSLDILNKFETVSEKTEFLARYDPASETTQLLDRLS